MTCEERGFYIDGVKWRNQLLALSCLIAFFAFGVFYFRYWVIQKPFGIILFIGEGLNPQILAAARVQSGNDPLAIDSLDYTALLRNSSADSAVPDLPAAATALATGTKVVNGRLAVDAEDRPLANLLERAREAGRMTGLITNGRLTVPPSAAFYGHTSAPNKWEDLARQLVDAGDLDLIMGGGATDFLPLSQGGRRPDEIDLLKIAGDNGYDLARNLAELEEVPLWSRYAEVQLSHPCSIRRRPRMPGPDDHIQRPVYRRASQKRRVYRGGFLRETRKA